MTAGLCIAGGLGVVAVVEDLCRRRVPNWLTAAGVAGGLACAEANRLRVKIANTRTAIRFCMISPFGMLNANDLDA